MSENELSRHSPFAEAFSGRAHEAFHLEGGSVAALLVHGFPGTPAEMRPLAEVLHGAGWTVEGLLLPGFGAQIETLFERKNHEWVEAVVSTLHRLQENHKPVILIGFSLGGALSLQTTTINPPDRLVLLAPFWELRGKLWNLLPLLRLVLPTVRPFRLLPMDFNDPRLRKGMGRFLPNVDLDDPQVQLAMRDFAVPIDLIAEIRQAGLEAWRLAPRVSVPTLVIQGVEDPVIPAGVSRRLAGRLGGTLRYLEGPGDHELLEPGSLSLAWIQEAVLAFGNEARY
jgi:carboxylesterase